MDIQLLGIGAIIILGFLITAYYFGKKISNLQNNKADTTLLEWLKSMEASLHLSSTNMVKTLQENSKELNERLDRAAMVIKDVGHEVGQMSEIGRSMKELQSFLKSPKLRGNIGEQVLKDLISQMFPKNSFHLQYQFKTGERVDAAIQTDAGILPIDSKFPMENFERLIKVDAQSSEHAALQKEFAKDIKRHIADIAKKYILPEEGTMDFALMYVPSESVYYELVNMLDVMEFARRSRVYCVSPSTLYAHLQTILLSFEGKKIETRSKDLFKMLRALQVDFHKVEENMLVLGKHINNASSQFANVNMGFTQIGQKINSTKSIDEPEKEKS
ncbi:MAG: DNA recombination protein RmuC [Candidatus Levybacteria bacterium]|nr:DNA recombination protein RmuC [Candidatus Levybacteria bacterium]